MATALASGSSFSDALEPRWRALAALAALAAGLAAAFADAAASLAGVWLHSSVYHQGVLVAPISLWLILRREDLGALSPTSDWRGVLLVSLSSALVLIGAASGVALIEHAAFVGALIGALLTAFGAPFIRRNAFALGFLIFMIPFGEELTPALQQATSVAVAATLNTWGVDILREGIMLTSSAGRFEIAPSCAGLRFLLASAMLSTLVGELAFGSWRKRACFFTVALLAAIMANWLRAFLIVLIATTSDMAIGAGPEHVALGWALYAAMIVGLIILARRLADRVEDRAPAPRQPIVAARYRLAPSGAALIILVMAAAYNARVISAPPADTPSSPLQPFHAQGFAVTEAQTGWTAIAPAADARATDAYRSADATIVVSIAAFNHDRRGAEIVAARVAVGDGENWRRIATREAAPRIETWEDNAGRRIDVVVRYWLGDRDYASPLALKRDLALQKLRGVKAPGGAIFIAAPHTANPEPAAALELFLRSMEPVAEWRARRRAAAA